MIDLLLSKEVQLFITEHQHDDPYQLLLKYKTIFNIPMSIVVDQIVGRKKAQEKLPAWHSNANIIYPPSLNLEQSSSGQTAQYKCSLLRYELGRELSGSQVLDLTGGFGVDSTYFSREVNAVHFVEPNLNLLDVAKHNLAQMGATNIHFYHSTAEDFLKSLSGKMFFDLIYIDPSRRSEHNKKVFSLHQCVPDVVQLQDKLFNVTDRLLIKASPLLDIDAGIKELIGVKKIVIISVHNECRELLFFCEKNFNDDPTIEAIEIGRMETPFVFKMSQERITEVDHCDPRSYLYEPYAALLKSGAFKSVASRFRVCKLSPNTHLYTSETIQEEFPGRIFKIDAFLKSDPKQIKKFFEHGRANVITRNYPLTVSELRKKIHLTEGGEKFLIGCAGVKQKFLIAAEKIR